MKPIILNENWSIQPLEYFRHGIYSRDDADWLPITVPAHWQQHPDLLRHAGKVVYRCHVPFAPGPDDENVSRYWLRINGAFYWSQPYWNGVDLGRNEGYFIPYEQEISELMELDNRLLIEVECPDEHDKFGKRMITGVFSHWDCLDPLSNPGGIWLPVEIQRSGPIRLQSARCHTETVNDRVAQIGYVVELDAALAGPIRLRWTAEPRTFAGEKQQFEFQRMVQAGRQQLSGLFKIRDPRRWWTHDLGDPDLYTFTLEVFYEGLLSDCHSFNFGIRQFEMRNWIPYLNGVRFLARGSNYPPGDMRIATMNAERCATDLRLARECHMNMLRVHAHVDHPALYDAADEAGVLLWQDFPLQWLYVTSVLPEARRQARTMVRLLYNHPSIAIWCMHNEPVFLADTTDETLVMRLRTYQTAFGFSWNRDVMDTQLKNMAEHEDPRRPVIRSSGEFDIPLLREGTDAHAYFGWYASYGTLAEAEILRRNLPANLRFVTEFGAQSFPNLESCLRFMPADINEIDFATLTARHGFQGDIMARWLPWREAESLADLIDMSQDYQAEINRYYIDRLRYHKYRPTGGIIPFSFIDAYPAVLWSIIDYWRVPKRSYYAMRMAFSPQYVFSLIEPRVYRISEPVDLPLFAVNDEHRAIGNLQLNAWLRDPNEYLLASLEHHFDLGADCLAQEIDRLRLTPKVAGRYSLELALQGGFEEIRHTYWINVD